MKLLLTITLLLLLVGCSYKPTYKTLTKSGFEYLMIMQNGKLTDVYILRSKDNSKEIQYYVNNNKWYFKYGKSLFDTQINNEREFKEATKNFKK